MKNQFPCIYFRVSEGARASSIKMDAIDVLLNTEAPLDLMADIRDESVFFFEIPQGLEQTTLQQIISNLVRQTRIEEAWNGFASGLHAGSGYGHRPEITLV